MSKRISKLLVISVICVLFLSLGSQVFAQKLPVVGISTGSSGTSWRDIMIAAMQEVGDEYKAAGKIADYKIVNNIVNGDATEQANILRDFISGNGYNYGEPQLSRCIKWSIKEAQEEGILVVSFDATVTAPGVVNITLDKYAWNKEKCGIHCLHSPERERRSNLWFRRTSGKQ